MPSFSQLPGELNLAFRAGDDFSAAVDFSISLVGYTVTSDIISTVGWQTVGTFTTTLTDAAAGVVNISLSDTQTAALPVGTYRWTMTGTQGGLTRTYLTGFVEVTR